MNNKKFTMKITESCANKLINIGKNHSESKSFLITFYEPKLSDKLIKEINKKNK